jgi:hypothetical protein
VSRGIRDRPLLVVAGTLALAVLLAVIAGVRVDRDADAGTRAAVHDANDGPASATSAPAPPAGSGARARATPSAAIGAAGSAAIADGPLAHQSVDRVPPTPAEAWTPQPQAEPARRRDTGLVFSRPIDSTKP